MSRIIARLLKSTISTATKYQGFRAIEMECTGTLILEAMHC